MATMTPFRRPTDDMYCSGSPFSLKKRKTTTAGLSFYSPKGEYVGSNLLGHYDKRMKGLLVSPAFPRGLRTLPLPFAAGAVVRSSGESNGDFLGLRPPTWSLQTMVQPLELSSHANTLTCSDSRRQLDCDNLGPDIDNGKGKKIGALEECTDFVPEFTHKFEKDQRERTEALKTKESWVEFKDCLFERGFSERSELNRADIRNVDESNQGPLWKKLYEETKHPSKSKKIIFLENEIKLHESKIEALRSLRIAKSLSSEKSTEADEILRDAFTPLTAEADLAVTDALEGSDRYEVLVMHTKSNIDVTRGVMQCLSPGTWLNDEVINVYMELLKERELQEPKRFLKCHFFNTFFYNKLFKDKRSYDYKAIRRWTTQKKLGYSLLDCDKILVPIHQDIHWCLAVVNIRDQKLEYLDSLKGSDSTVLKILGRYIADEANDKNDKALDVSKWEQDFPKDIPEQLNGCDCGMFMVKYADFHSRGAPLAFTQEHMEYFRRKMVWEILQLKAT